MKSLMITCMLLMSSVLSAANFTVNKIDHIVLKVPQTSKDAVIEFYTKILGLNVERELEELHLLQLRAGGSLIDLIVVPENKIDQSQGNVDHFCLEITTNDLKQVQKYLVENGVEVTSEVVTRYGAGGYGNSLYLLDPIGNAIELKMAESLPVGF